MLSSVQMISKLRALPKSRKVKILSSGNHAWMACQWHYVQGKEREKTPSFLINLRNNGKFKAGTGRCFACLPPEEEIRTERGLVSIKDIKKTDKVYDHKGNLQKIVRLIKKPRTSNVLEIFLQRNNDPLKVTEDHIVLVYRNKKIIEVKAANIKKTDKLIFPNDLEEKYIDKFDTGKLLNYSPYDNRNRERITSLPLTPEYMWFYGMYLANGSYSRGSIRITINPKKELEAQKWENCLHKLGLKSKRHTYKNRPNILEIICSSTDLQNIFMKTFGTGCDKKIIPQWMLHLSKRQIKQLYLGVVQDGNSINKVRLTSKHIVYAMEHIAHRLRKQIYFYYTPSVMQKDGILRKPTWLLDNRAVTNKIVKRKIKHIIYNGTSYSLIPIKKIQQALKQPSTVYDVTVENSSTFLTKHAVVHNCGKFVKKFEAILDPSKENLSDVLAVDDEDEYVQPLYNETIDAILHDEDPDDFYLPNALPWNRNEDWRSIRGILMHAIKAKLFFEEDTERLMAYLPCSVEGNHVGGIKANLEKKGKRNYFNDKGDWVNSHGLFPYDYTVKFMAKYNLSTIVLVEGPRDALRCLQLGIPAMAILGTQNWSENKSELVCNLNPKRVISAQDGDKAGKRATVKIFDSLKNELPIYNFNFDKYGSGLDPGNCPKVIMRKLRSYII